MKHKICPSRLGQDEASPMSGEGAFKPLGRLDGTAFPQYKVEWLGHQYSVR